MQSRDGAAVAWRGRHIQPSIVHPSGPYACICEERWNEIKNKGDGGRGSIHREVVLKLGFEIRVGFSSLKKGKGIQRDQNGMSRGKAKTLAFREQREVLSCWNVGCLGHVLQGWHDRIG